MIHAVVSPAETRVPAVLAPIRIQVTPYDETIDDSVAIRLVALSVLDDRLCLSLDPLDPAEDLQDDVVRERQAQTSRWWRTVFADRPTVFGWTYGPVPLSGSPSAIDGADLVRLCEAHHADLALLDYVLFRLAQRRWPTTAGELPIPTPPDPEAMVSYGVPLFPEIVHAGAFTVDPETGEATPTEPAEPDA
jgi:hypothetical protein